MDPEEMLLAIQTLQAQQQQFTPAGYSYLPNGLGIQGFHVGSFSGLQTKPLEVMPAMLQVQAPQQQQLQAAVSVPYFPFAPGLNVTYSSPGLSSQLALQVSGTAAPSHPMRVAPGEPFSPLDEYTLTCVVNESNGESLEEMLQPLNGVNGHSTNEWIAHYLTNFKRMSRKVERSDSEVEAFQSKPHVPSAASGVLGLGRTHGNRLLEKIFSQQVDRGYESCSPTPLGVDPINIGNRRGHRFTEDDALYFRKSLLRIFRQMPHDVSLRRISQELAKNTPHHSQNSWSSYMRTNRSIVDEVRNETLENFGLSSGSRSYKRKVSKIGRNPVYCKAKGSPSNDLTPPTVVAVNGSSRRFNKYTEEDASFFRKIVARLLERNTRVSIRQISEEMAKLAGHHPFSSWLWYAYSNKHIIEEVRREVLGGAIHKDSSISPQREDTEEVEGQSEGEEPSHDDNVSLHSSGGEEQLHTLDREYLRKRGGLPAYTPSERRALAKYIANITLKRWDNDRDSWVAFQNEYCGHSVSNWMGWYNNSRNKAEIDDMVRRFESRNAKRKQAGGLIVTAHRSTNEPVPVGCTEELVSGHPCGEAGKK